MTTPGQYGGGPPPGYQPQYPAPGYQPYPPQQPQYGYYPQPQYPRPTGTNGMATASLVLALLTPIIGIGSILGVIFGCIALSQIGRTGEQGKGMAIAGIVIGAVFAVALVVVLVVAISYA